MQEQHKLGGRLRLTLLDPRSGEVVMERRHNNLVTLAGRRFLAEILTGQRVFEGMNIVVGDGTEPPELDDQALSHQLDVVEATEISEAVTDKVDEPYRILTVITGTFEAKLGDEELHINEAGIQLASADGNSVLYNRVTFEPIEKKANLQLTLSWELLF
jgi:hypothetical protein